MHGTVAYTSTLLSLGVMYVKMYRFLSSTKEDAHKKENWILFSVSRCTIFLRLYITETPICTEMAKCTSVVLS